MAKVTNSRSVQALYEKYVGDDPERVAAFERAASDSEVARMIHDLRTVAKLSQRELADRVGTTQSVISRARATAKTMTGTPLADARRSGWPRRSAGGSRCISRWPNRR